MRDNCLCISGLFLLFGFFCWLFSNGASAWLGSNLSAPPRAALEDGGGEKVGQGRARGRETDEMQATRAVGLGCARLSLSPQPLFSSDACLPFFSACSKVLSGPSAEVPPGGEPRNEG